MIPGTGTETWSVKQVEQARRRSKRHVTQSISHPVLIILLQINESVVVPTTCSPYNWLLTRDSLQIVSENDLLESV
jgi:hypothetical protein